MILHTLEERHRDILAAYLDLHGKLAVVIIDNDLIITHANRGFETLLQLTQSPVGDDITELLSPEGRMVFEAVDIGEHQSALLAFTPPNRSGLVLNGVIFHTEQGFVLFGEHLLRTEEETLKQMTLLNNELINLTRETQRQRRELEHAHSQIKVLRGLLPICSACKKIRDEQGYWKKIEAYITEYSEASFSHGMCDECMKELYGDL